MRRRAVIAVLMCLSAACAACDSDSGPPAPLLSLTGSWSGGTTLQGVAFAFEMELTESGTAVVGSGTLASPQETASYEIDGSYNHPSINLRLLFTDRPPITLTGTVGEDRDRIEARLAGAGFGGEMIALTRRL